MATKVEAWQAAEGKQFPTQAEAEYWDRLCALTASLREFQDYDSFDSAAAAAWLLDTYSMTELPK